MPRPDFALPPRTVRAAAGWGCEEGSGAMAERGGLKLSGLAAVAGAGLALSGCLGGPTYGTGVSANRQLVTDLSSMMSLAPKEQQKIDYKPRPELVKPGQAELAENALPAPQQAVASADNPQWPESPEERRARIRATATANQDNPFYEPEVAGDRVAKVQNTGPQRSHRADELGVVSVADLSKGREGFNKRLAENTQGSPTSRKFLSEPPLDYRKAADTAPQNDIGEDEWKKEKRLKAEARKKAGKSGGWFDWLPGA